MDETHLRLNVAPNKTLVAPDEKRYVVVDDTSSYAARYDMIACCSGDQVFPPIIFTPQDRKEWGQHGINGEMMLYYIEHVLGQAVGAIDLFPLTLILDRSTIHNAQKMLDAFNDFGCEDLQTIRFMPPNGAK